jgi:hypothetical protein
MLNLNMKPKKSGEFIKQGQPVISVDTKKKELIGNFKNKKPAYTNNTLKRHSEIIHTLRITHSVCAFSKHGRWCVCCLDLTIFDDFHK